MNRTTWCTVAALGFGLAAGLRAQQQAPSGVPGTYAGPSVLSRWSRMTGSQPPGPVLRGFLHGSYAFMDGLTGPVDGVNSGTGREFSVNSHSGVGGGGLTLNRTNARSSLSLGYSANYTATLSDSANSYRGLNQDANLMYERQLTRRWGFFTGHTAGTQNSILGLARPTAQRNFFEPAYSPSNEALDARLRSVSSGAGFYFQHGSRINGSMDGGFFSVSRQSNALVSSRGERAQGEIAYRFSRNQSIGALYSFSHFYFPRGFGETYVHSVMLSYTRRLNRTWNVQLAAGPYQADSERLRAVAVDPFIAALTGNASTIEVFRGRARGIGLNVSLGGVMRRQNVLASFRRSVDSGNGVTLSSLSQNGQLTYTYQTSRDLSLGATLFLSRLSPLLTGLSRSANFQSYGGNFNVGYRLTSALHLIGNVGVHSISYDEFFINQVRKVAMIGLAYSPSTLPLIR